MFWFGLVLFLTILLGGLTLCLFVIDMMTLQRLIKARENSLMKERTSYSLKMWIPFVLFDIILTILITCF